ncbi:F-box only protein 43 isoform X2 [Corythoichthys intestinalis]|uniref:F-box only protein 43 isoform X2 n=1 Tax=Corythoichthys intestinalis TaxID=161448 RepID=UPI0025A5B76E|nr:F-box only protein 43 isoform X2 [Corythoichthys intestinalis]
MQCTPESHDGVKHQPCYECFDSGYSGSFQSPQKINGFDFGGSYPSGDCKNTPKKKLRLSLTPKESSGVRFLHNDTKGVQRSSTLSWCETPKICKRDVSLRHKLIMCSSTKYVKSDSTMSPCDGRLESSIRTDHQLSVSFDSDTAPQTPSTLKLEKDLTLSAWKHRLLFSQGRTSTLEDGTLSSGDSNSLERRISLLDFISSKENLHSPVTNLSSDLYDSSNVLCTPSSIHTPKCIRFLREDSGFSSLDKSQDSSVDHNGSFQELLLSASKRNSETPNLTDTKRRSRLQRQKRLSTLEEGGSLSDEDQSDRKHQYSHTCINEVFKETPTKVLSVKCIKTTSDGLESTSQSYTTPLRKTTATPDNPHSRTTSVKSHTTPKTRTITTNLSLTPALQLIHNMCEQRTKMYPCKSPSLKVHLRTIAALAEAPTMFGTSMPLAGLIGRKMGLGKVDILTELRKRNLGHILAVVFGHLSPECVYRCGQVCKDWNEIIQHDKQAHLKREIHRSAVEGALELGGTGHVTNAENRLARLQRSALKTVQVQSSTPTYCTPQSGSRTSQSSSLSLGNSTKRDKFIEVAKTLFKDECLKECPRCQHPAKCHLVKGEGVCTRADCAFQFCTACLCTFHGSKECRSQSAGRRRKDVLLPGSAQSKRNIRRL